MLNYENFVTKYFVNKKGQKVLVFAGTNPLSLGDVSGIQMFQNKLPEQTYDADKAYQNFYKRYEDKSVIVLTEYT